MTPPAEIRPLGPGDGKRGYRFIEHAQWRDKVYRSVIMSKTIGADR